MKTRVKLLACMDLMGAQDPLKMTIESGSAVNGLTISHGFSRRAVYRGGNVTATVEVSQLLFHRCHRPLFRCLFLT